MKWLFSVGLALSLLSFNPSLADQKLVLEKRKTHEKAELLALFVKLCLDAEFYETSIFQKFGGEPKNRQQLIDDLKEIFDKFPKDPTAEFQWLDQDEFYKEIKTKLCQKLYQESTKGLFGGYGHVPTVPYQAFNFIDLDNEQQLILIFFTNK
ncbi:MAG: hypothetical protein KDD58_12080 [Bdellovibrionales bacterium]|nr:hypothetical protein [Bdellovibrionales bacterium]